MSRSVRKTKIFGITTAETEKQDKRRWNRTFRKVCKKLIRLEKDPPNQNPRRYRRLGWCERW